MFITNWLAKADDHRGLVYPEELTIGNVRIYGNISGNPKFSDGEYVQTAIIMAKTHFHQRLRKSDMLSERIIWA